MAKEYVPYDGPVVTRAQALACGTKWYFSGKVCKNGHLAQRKAITAACPVCKVEHGQKCRAANKDKLTKAKIAWANANKDKRAVICRRYYEANRDKIAAAYRADPEPTKARVRNWVEGNRDARRAIGRNYRARLNAADGSHTAADVLAIRRDQRGRCGYCRVRLGADFHVDHIIALSRGGSNARRNLQLLCAPCNISKRAADPIVFARRMGLLI